jgi:Ca2+-binding RTX toxin-like protein
MQNRIHRSVIELLERRRLLSAGPTPVSLNGSGQLRINGTNGPDVIRVSLEAADTAKLDVTVNGSVTTFDVASVKRGIRVDGRGGNDDIRVDQTNGAISIPLNVQAGSGDDTVVGGAGDDRIDGSSGNDLLEGEAGDDSLLGGAGDDSINGGSGNDTAVGSSGNDHIAGELGDDSLNGGSGDDSLDGGSGSDRIRGSSGKNSFSSSDDAPEILDDKGTDTLTGGEHDATDDHGAHVEPGDNHGGNSGGGGGGASGQIAHASQLLGVSAASVPTGSTTSAPSVATTSPTTTVPPI